MNNIFKVIWNHATQTWTAVGELASAKGKSKSIKLAAISAALLGSVSGVQAATHITRAADKLIAMSVELPDNTTATPATTPTTGTTATTATTAIPDTHHAKVNGKDSIAMGVKAEAGGNSNIEKAIAVGYKTEAQTNYSIAIGSEAMVVKAQTDKINARSIAIGTQARVEPGPDSSISSGLHDSIAIGTRSLATMGTSIVIGRDASSMRNASAANFQSGENTIAIGTNASADWGRSIAIGLNSRTAVGDSVAIGNEALASGSKGSVALGPLTHALGDNSVALGPITNANGNQSTAVGLNARSYGPHSTAIGENAYTYGQSSVALGQGASTGWWSARRSIAIGQSAHAATDDSYALGAESFSGHFRSLAMGKKAITYGEQSLAMGSSTQNGIGAMAIANNSAALGTESRAIGEQTIAFGNNAVSGVTKEGADNIKSAYEAYRTAYNTYNALEKDANDAQTTYNIEKAIVSRLATNLKIFTGKYGSSGALRTQSTEFKNALVAAGLSYTELETLAGNFTQEPKDSNVDAAIAQKEIINKFANIDKTGAGEENEKLAHLVELARNLISKVNTAEKAKNTLGDRTKGAIKKREDGKTEYDNAKIKFEAAYKKISKSNAISIGNTSVSAGENSIALGNNITVEKDNAVVLGSYSDGAPTVKKVNSANVNGVVYSGFAGNLGATKTDGSSAEDVEEALNGRFVSVGSETKEENGKKVYGERQIKHVAAGEIASTSTDAINGSQLYAVASGLRNASPMVYTNKDGNKVVKYPDGKYYPEGSVKIGDEYYPAGTTAENKANAKPVEAIPVTDVVVSMNNPGKPDTGKENTAGNKVTLTNVAPGAKTIITPDKDKDGNLLTKVGDKYYKADQLKADGQPKENAETSTKVENTPVENAKTGLADLDNSVSSNALTVADAKNLGWVVSVGKDGKDYAEKVTNANEVRFNGTDGIKVTGETKGSVRHINISLEKGAVVKQDEYTIEGKTYVSIDGKLYNKDDVDFSGNKPKAKEGKQPSNYIVKDSTVVNNTTPDNPVPVDAKVDKADHFVDGNTVYTAIQKSGWTVGKADESLTKKAFEKTENVNKDEKVNPNDAVRFADGKGITVKTATVEETNEDGSKQTTTVVKFDTNLPIDYSVTNKNATGDTLKQAKDGNWYKEADVNADGTVKVTDGNKPTPETIVKTESGITLKNDATTSYTPADKTTDKNKGTGGVQLNNVGWAETPDQAVNKDQLDQTVNKSGFTVKLNDGNTTDGNKTDGSLLSTPEKVTPNDVINFKNGKGTTIKAVTKRENGVDTTTVSVDVDSSASPIVYTDGAGKELKKEGDKYYRNDDVKDAVKIGDKFYKNGTTEDDVNKGKAEEIKAVEKVIASIPGNSGNPASLKVGDGNVSSDSKEAVNGKQLHETNVLVDKNTQVINTTNTQVNKNTQAINAINNAINNQSGAFDRLERKINKQGKEARAGIAGANAAAALPQVYTAGKSMVAASAGTFKGQNALAVGYSRASDNGKMILKLQGNANTSGDIGAGVGVGYQW
ncbi:YadA-like family protein [Haemophilus seminalis]|jgi:hypothetical protein|uniref:Adhesin n=1 Tax=Haemophilus seminalis TaxID=2582921 RepID=A0ABQ6SL56_9PAST|nr:YadA-like family protein [Haemophilus seminalis]KAA5523007.1 hypothetical protein F2S80_05225 [Haemophilus seminalis]MDK7280657.1 YadA-like family protein [Haemophilus seminalis]